MIENNNGNHVKGIRKGKFFLNKNLKQGPSLVRGLIINFNNKN